MAKPFGATVFEIGVGGPQMITGTADPRVTPPTPAPPAGTYYARTGAGAVLDFFVKASATTTDWMPLLASGYHSLFGDGSGGDLTVAGVTNEASTTSGDVFYNDLSIGAAGVYRPEGRRIFVLGTLTIVAGGVMTMSGNNGALGVAGAATVGYGSNIAGTIGGAGAVGAGGAAGNSTASAIPNGALTSLGGAGGAGTGGAGGAAGTIVANTVNGSVRDLVHASNNMSAGAVQVNIGGGTGGGAGGGDGALVGGGGGGGAGAIILCARRIVCEGAITAVGGNGAAGPTTNRGGGGGGGGGRIIILTQSFQGAGVIGAPSVRGGLAGASGGGAGVAGTAGADGFAIVLPA